MTEKIPNMMDVESEVKRITAEKHPNEMSLMADLLNIYTTGFSLIGSWKRTEENDVQFAQLLLVARSFHSMRSAMILILSGYYGQAMTLLRTVTENWLIGRDCEAYQQTLDALLHDKYRLGAIKQKLRYIDMAERIGERDKVKDIIYEEDYRFQSRFTHAGRLSLAIMRKRGTDELNVAPDYDELLFLTCCELLMRNCLISNELMYSFLKSISDDTLKTWNTTVEPAVNNIADWLVWLRQEYGSSINDDEGFG